MKRDATCNKHLVRFQEKKRCHELLADFETVTSSFPNGEGPRGSISNKSRENRVINGAIERFFYIFFFRDSTMKNIG
jgi:hypothetical protein